MNCSLEVNKVSCCMP